MMTTITSCSLPWMVFEISFATYIRTGRKLEAMYAELPQVQFQQNLSLDSVVELLSHIRQYCLSYGDLFICFSICRSVIRVMGYLILDGIT